MQNKTNLTPLFEKVNVSLAELEKEIPITKQVSSQL